MKNIKSMNRLPAILFMGALTFLSACTKEDDVTSTEVQLLSFGPTGAKHGEKIVFVGNNLDKVTSIELPGISIPASSFASKSSEVIEVTVPNEAEEGMVVLKTATGDITSKTLLSFNVEVTIQSITPQAKPGTNITITGNFVNWITSVYFEDIEITEFVSKSLTTTVFTVPLEAQTGILFISVGGTEPVTLRSEEEIIITLPTITSLAPNPVDRGAELTITGTNLDLTREVVFRGGATVLVSPSDLNAAGTQLKIIVPEEANRGKITLVAFSSVGVESPQDLELVGGLPPLPALGVAFYTDGLENGWQKWGGWGSGASDIASEENVRDGTKSIKAIMGGDWGGALQLGGGNTSTAGRTTLVFYIFGGAGTNGKQLNALINGAEHVVVITEGEWTEYSLPISSLGNPATINEFTFQDRGWSGTLYIDHIGLR
jgi:hypothetical protein